MIISVLGLLLGFGLIILGQLMEGGELSQLVQHTAALIVFGGTLGATLLSSSIEDFSGAIRGLLRVFLTNAPDYEPLIKEIVEMATIARKDGLLALEGKVGSIKNPFFAGNLRHLIDGYDAEVIKHGMEDRMSKEEEAKNAIAKVWETAGGFSPTVGIIGAVLGLIHVMSNLSDSSKLGSGIAVAFVATVYGVSSANLLFLPVANKLKKLGKWEMLEMEIIYMGLTSLQAGLNPRVIEGHLFNLIGGEAHGEGGEGGEVKKAA